MTLGGCKADEMWVELKIGSAGPGTVYHPGLNTLPIAQTPDPLQKPCPAIVLTNLWLGPTPT